MIEVDLTVEEAIEGYRVGFRRYRHALELRLRSRFHTRNMWVANGEGACAELAAAKGLGQPWTGRDYLVGRGPPPVADVGTNIEVRLSWSQPPTLNYDDRPFADGKHPTSRFLLVTGDAGNADNARYFLHGWADRDLCLAAGRRVVYPERELLCLDEETLYDLATILSGVLEPVRGGAWYDDLDAPFLLPGESP